MMQGLWSRVLTGEAQKSGSFSKRTLNFLSTLDKRDAELITNLGSTVWNQHNSPLPIVFSYEEEAIQKLGLDYDSLRHLESIGVITLGTMNYSVQFEKEYGYFTYYDKTIMMKIGTKRKNTFMPIKQNSVDIGMVLLTNIGRELIRISGSKPDDNYFYSALREFMEENEVFTPLQFNKN